MLAGCSCPLAALALEASPRLGTPNPAPGGLQHTATVFPTAMAPKTDSLAAVRAAVAKGGSRAIAAAAQQLECSPGVLDALLLEMSAACTAVEQLHSGGLPMHWQWALSSFIQRLSAEQLREWRWDTDAGLEDSESLEVVPWLLCRSRDRIVEIHMERCHAQQDAWDDEFGSDDELADDAFMEAGEELAMQAMDDADESLAVRDGLVSPLLLAAVRGGAACLSLAQARELDEEREASWGATGAWWADTWAPDAAAHAAFHPRFRAGVRAMLLASHRGLPGTGPDGGPIHLPPPALLEVVRAMAGRDMEAAWVPLARVPSDINLNSVC